MMNANRLIPCIVVGFLVAVVVYYWYHDTNEQIEKDERKESEEKKEKKEKEEEEENEEKEEKEENDGMKMDEGVVKYECEWTEIKDVIKYSSIKQLLNARNKLHDLKLIDVYKENGIGFGNISQRILNNDNSKNNKSSFYISGSQTSKLDNDKINESHFCIVNDYDIEKNQLSCYGAIRASSESMTHAIIYQLNSKINCVVHIHHNKLWNKCLNKLPTTNKNVKYGTPEMAKEVERLYKNNIDDIQNQKIFVMGGHQDGLISFGHSIQSAMDLMIQTYQKYICNHDDSVDNVNNDNDDIGSTENEQDEQDTMNINIIDDYA